MPANTPPIEELEDALRKATPGPWKASPYRGQTGSQVWAGEPGPDAILICADGDSSDDDATLIALLRNNAAQLLSLAKLALLVREGGEEMAIERAIGQEQIDRLTSIIRDLVEAIDAPRSGDDSIWDDLLNFGMHEGGPLGRARDFLRTLEGLIK